MKGFLYLGGFDGTSNVLAGKLYDVPVKGAQAHAYTTYFDYISDLDKVMLCPKDGGEPKDLIHISVKWRTLLLSNFQLFNTDADDGELAALVSYAIALPNGFMAVVDTYDVKRYPSRMHGAVILPNTLSHNEYRYSTPHATKI